MPVFIGPINPLVTANVVGVQEILSPRHTVVPKASVTDAVRSCTRILRTPGKVSQTGRDSSTPRDVNSDENSRLSPPSSGSNSNSISPAHFRNQEVISPIHPSIGKGSRNAEPIDAPIDEFLAVNGHSTSFFSGVIGLEAVPSEVSNVHARRKDELHD